MIEKTLFELINEMISTNSVIKDIILNLFEKEKKDISD